MAQQINLPPIFDWGGRIGAAPPNQRYPGWLNINRTQDVAISLTKIAGRHTIKGGFYNNHSYKAQNVGAGGGLSFQGTVNFGNDNNNPLDTGFGYANAATGIFTQYQQAEKFVEGSMIYNNTEFYIQDNWKVNNRLTLDYGMRFTRQQPQHDQFQQMSNFFPDQWNASQAQVLYIPGCSNGAATCTGNTQREGPENRAGHPPARRREQHAGAHRHADSRIRRPAERHQAGRRRHLRLRLHLADARLRSALRRRLRRLRRCRA